MAVQSLPALDPDAEGAYRRLESDIAAFAEAGRPAAAAMRDVLASYEHALQRENGSGSSVAWAAFVDAVDGLRALAASIPLPARTAATRHGLSVLDAIARENDDLRTARR